MTRNPLTRLTARVGTYFYADAMRRGGIDNTMKASRLYNRVRYARRTAQHRRCYEQAFQSLLEENHPGYAGTHVTIRDGWAIDTSGTLPHLQELLTEADQIIEERGGRKDLKRRVNADKPY